MDVFVIPVGADRYELYCEHRAEIEPEAEGPPAGWMARLQRRFGQILRDAEDQEEQVQQEDREDQAQGPTRREAPRGLAGRLQARLMSWIVERIAEQRLLWNLRTRTAAVAVHPDDVPFEQVLPQVRRMLRRDYERHRFWLVIDAIGLAVTALFTPIPGPNLLSWYFTFRVGGHWLSMRGAAQGQHRVAWSGRPSPPLASLRDVWSLLPDARRQRVREVADELRLAKLPRFVDRVVRVKTGQ
jgi:hypothetical protein